MQSSKVESGICDCVWLFGIAQSATGYQTHATHNNVRETTLVAQVTEQPALQSTAATAHANFLRKMCVVSRPPHLDGRHVHRTVALQSIAATAYANILRNACVVSRPPHSKGRLVHRTIALIAQHYSPSIGIHRVCQKDMCCQQVASLERGGGACTEQLHCRALQATICAPNLAPI